MNKQTKEVKSNKAAIHAGTEKASEKRGEVITAENVQTIAERVALRALRTAYAAGGHPFIRSLYANLCGDIAERKRDSGAALSDGYDVAQVAAAVLCEYIGQALDAPAPNGGTRKTGECVDVLRAAFRAVHKYIYAQRQRVDKCRPAPDYTAAYIPPRPFAQRRGSAKKARVIIAKMNLTARQKEILSRRLGGASIHGIAAAMGLHKSTVQEHVKAIQSRANAAIITAKA